MRRKIAKLFNNRFTNPIIVFFRIERFFAQLYNPYKNFKADATKKSLREIAGFSHNEYMDKILATMTSHLKTFIGNNCKQNAKVIEIGCGPGNFVAELTESYEMTGLDINESMVQIAGERLPQAKFIHGDFLSVDFKEKYDAVYCIGALQYFYPSQLKRFMDKIDSILVPGGIFYVNFPHALTKQDTKFPDLSYISYSPEKIRNEGKRCFEIIHDRHTIDDRKVMDFDTNPYENPLQKGFRTYLNSYSFVFKKPL